MSETNHSPRATLFREAATLQLKLIADGIRDAILIPVSLVAAILGLLEGGDKCDQLYQRVLKLGRRSERWINLFGTHRPMDANHPAGSMDKILGQVESVVLDQYKKGRSATETKAAIRKALRTETEDTAPREDDKSS